ncbi:MAG: hypothetical protein JXB15_12075 [Anaerolineales bacterium]|nr:hypothetical protein [Anaerolineales bacterium]
MKNRACAQFVSVLLLFTAIGTLSIHAAAARAPAAPQALPGSFNKLAPFTNETGASTNPNPDPCGPVYAVYFPALVR